MPEPFLIHIANLNGDCVQKIDAILSSEFIDVDEPELQFKDAVKVCGEVYLTSDDLVIHLSASTTAQMSCSVCNRLTPFTLAINNFYHAVSLKEIKESFYDFRPILRESLLIELPKVIECNNNCPERASLAPYLRKVAKPDESEHYFPFNNLKLP